jgi:hypothetical protein
MDNKTHLNAFSAVIALFFLVLAGGSQDSSGSKASDVGPKEAVDGKNKSANELVVPPTADTSKKRNGFNEAVKASCGWKLSPELSGFYIGMSLEEAKRAGGGSLKCKYSEPQKIVGKTLSERVYEGSNDEFETKFQDGYATGRAAARCDSTVGGNKIAMWFFPESVDGPLLLGKVYNWLDTVKSDADLDVIVSALNEKFGVSLDKGPKCSSPDGTSFGFEMNVSRPWLRSDGSWGGSYFMTVQDDILIQHGTEIVHDRDRRGREIEASNEKKKIADEVKKGTY